MTRRKARAFSQKPDRPSGRHRLWLAASLAYGIGLAFFVYKYVPLVLPFLLAVGPFLAAAFFLEAWRIEVGFFFFLFVFPLINSAPYFFGIDGRVPHAPTALLLFLFFFWGWLFHRSRSPDGPRSAVPLSRPFRWLAAILVISALATFFRFSLFFPFGSDAIRDVAVNVLGVRAGGAIMSAVFNFLSYLTGLLFFSIAYRVLQSPLQARRAISVLTISMALSLGFASIQKYLSPGLGNTGYWRALNQINGTFKDPNAFGAYVAAVLPLVLAMASLAKGRRRLPFLMVFFAALGTVPAIGSRIAFAALCSALLIFFVLAWFGKKRFPKKIFASITLALVLGVILTAGVMLIGPGGTLIQRFRSDVRLLLRNAEWNSIISQKPRLWGIAAAMVRDYPISGVGLGGYIIELPNYSLRMGLTSNLGYTDSAENYTVQAVAELGLFGLALFAWIFILIIGQMIRVIRTFRREPAGSLLAAGITAGLIAFFVTGLFHSYVGSFEIQYLFWLLAALLFRQAGWERSGPVLHPRAVARTRWLTAVVLVAFGSSSVASGLLGLSPARLSGTDGWRQDYGFYPEETDSQGLNFRWAKRRAGLEIPALGPELVFDLAVPPAADLKENPVSVRIFRAGRYFRKKDMLGEFRITTADWREFRYPVPAAPSAGLHLLFEVDRDWQPLTAGAGADPRRLGFRLTDFWYRYPSAVPPDILGPAETVPRDQWRGTQGNLLWGKGSSDLRFTTAAGPIFIDLSVRGEKAFGVGPIIAARLDGRLVAKTMITEAEWTQIVLPAVVDAGEHVLRVEFLNDFSRPGRDEDRNVELGDVKIMVRKK